MPERLGSRERRAMRLADDVLALDMLRFHLEFQREAEEAQLLDTRLSRRHFWHATAVVTSFVVGPARDLVRPRAPELERRTSDITARVNELFWLALVKDAVGKQAALRIVRPRTLVNAWAWLDARGVNSSLAGLSGLGDEDKSRIGTTIRASLASAVRAMNTDRERNPGVYKDLSALGWRAGESHAAYNALSVAVGGTMLALREGRQDPGFSI